MLTIQQYNDYKKKLLEVSEEMIRLEARATQLKEQLMTQYGLTVEQAEEELNRLQGMLPEMEATFETKFKEFMEKWKAFQQT